MWKLCFNSGNGGSKGTIKQRKWCRVQGDGDNTEKNDGEKIDTMADEKVNVGGSGSSDQWRLKERYMMMEMTADEWVNEDDSGGTVKMVERAKKQQKLKRNGEG